MGRAATKPTNWVDRIRVEIKRDRKRAAVLGILCAVMLVVGVRLVAKQFLPGKAGAAVASNGRQKAKASRPAPAGLTGGGEQAPGQKALKPPLDGPAVVDRDLFAPNPVLFPSAETVTPPPVVTPMDTAAQKEAERQVTIQAIQTLARTLSLQSTVIGSAGPTAIINGRVLKTGEWINGFQVVDITSRSCTIEKDGMRVTLEMAK